MYCMSLYLFHVLRILCTWAGELLPWGISFFLRDACLSKCGVEQQCELILAPCHLLLYLHDVCTGVMPGFASFRRLPTGSNAIPSPLVILPAARSSSFRSSSRISLAAEAPHSLIIPTLLAILHCRQQIIRLSLIQSQGTIFPGA